MKVKNHYPDPRNRNDSWTHQDYKQTVENDGRTIRFTTNDSGRFPWGSSIRVIELPPGLALNLCLTLEVEGTANLDWGYIFMMYDAAKQASDSSSILCQWRTPAIHSAKRFVVPESGKVRIQYVLPKTAGESIAISDIAIVDDAALEWMRNNDEWWIHGDIMPLPGRGVNEWVSSSHSSL